MKLLLGFSPCPNDTFIFDAMVHGRIDTEGLEFDYFLADIEELNRKAIAAETDITKISFFAFAYTAGNYLILDSGSALGRHNGPLVISKRKLGISDLVNARIAIPGRYTTANMLFSLIWPDAVNKTEYLFSDITEALLNDEVDAGLIIHETRFTYHKKGLYRVADLGECWEDLTGLPIPLGTIVINRRIPENIALKVNRIIRRSIDFAFHNPKLSKEFVASHARELESRVINQHIKLFVNDYTLDLGGEGKKAIDKLYKLSVEKEIVPEMPVEIFLTSR